VELYFHSPNTSSWRGAQLKHRDNFTFTFLYYHVFSLASFILLLLNKDLKGGSGGRLENTA
jgi:hypothetical protein